MAFNMQSNVEKRMTRAARNTLLINPNDAAYWLAASSFVDGNASPPPPASCDDDQGRFEVLPATKSFASTFGNLSTRRPRLTPVPAKRLAAPNGPPPQTQLPTLPPSALVPEASQVPFCSPRKAPPTPVMMESDKKCVLPLSPMSPLPSSNTGVASGLLPPLRLSTQAAPPSPCPSSHPGSSLLHATPQFTHTQEGHLSVQSGLSSNDSRQSHVGATIISAFPSPPRRIESRARKLDESELRQLARQHPSVVERFESMALAQPSSKRISKPLPSVPVSDDLSTDSSSLHDSYDDAADDDVSGVSRAYPPFTVRRAAHRPMCPYAYHEDATEDLCGCEPIHHRPYASGVGGLMSTSAPDLLDCVQSSSGRVNKEKTQRDLDAAKKVMYRLSDEIEALKADAQQEQSACAGPKRTIKWQDEEEEKERAREREKVSVVISPLNKALPTAIHEKQRLRSLTPDPSRPIQGQLWPAHTMQHGRTPAPGPSTGLTIGMMHAANDADVNGLLPLLPPSFLSRNNAGQRSFDDLRATFPPSSPSTPPFAASRRLISTVRSHDRHPGSRASPTRSAYSAAGAQDEQAAFVGRHHRQTSSKSSSASSGVGTAMTHMTSGSTSSQPSSHHDYASSTSSTSFSPQTPPSFATNVQGNGKGMLPQSKRDAKATPFVTSTLRTPSPKRHKQDSAFFASAVEPFPIASYLYDGERVEMSMERARSRAPHHPVNRLADAQRRPNQNPLTPMRTYYGASPRLAGPSPHSAAGGGGGDGADSNFGFAM